MNIYDEARKNVSLCISSYNMNERLNAEQELYKYINQQEKNDELAKKVEELLELYQKLLKYIGLYNSSTYCTKETRKDLKEKIKKTQTLIDELEKELEALK